MVSTIILHQIIGQFIAWTLFELFFNWLKIGFVIGISLNGYWHIIELLAYHWIISPPIHSFWTYYCICWCAVAIECVLCCFYSSAHKEVLVCEVKVCCYPEFFCQYLRVIRCRMRAIPCGSFVVFFNLVLIYRSLLGPLSALRTGRLTRWDPLLANGVGESWSHHCDIYSIHVLCWRYC